MFLNSYVSFIIISIKLKVILKSRTYWLKRSLSMNFFSCLKKPQFKNNKNTQKPIPFPKHEQKNDDPKGLNSNSKV